MQALHPVTEITRALTHNLQSDGLSKSGLFRVLHWPNEIARREAQILMELTDPEKRDADFYNKYYGYCAAIQDSPNVGVTLGLEGLLRNGAGLSTTVNSFTQAKTFLGVGNGMVYGALTAAIVPDGGGAPGGSLDTASSQFVLNPVTLINTTTTFAAGDVIFFTDSTIAPNNLTAPAVSISPANRLNYSTIASVAVAGGNVTITTTEAQRNQRATGTYVVRAGNPTATDLISTAAGGKYYKGCTVAVTESIINGKPTLTWQVDYTASEAVGLTWLECIIGSVTGAGSAPATAQTTLPTGTLLACSAWYPTPLSKGATSASQQYVLSLG